MSELVRAMFARDEVRVVDLVHSGADPDVPDESGVTALDVAVGTGDLRFVDQLLSAGADPNAVLASAAWNEHASEAVVRRLLDAGAEPDRPDACGSTALYLAAVSGNAAIVRVLLAAGADPNRHSNGPSDGTPLCGAASWDHQETVKALLEGGADPNQPEQDGFVPLSLAVEAMHRASTEYLLAAGADP